MDESRVRSENEGSTTLANDDEKKWEMEGKVTWQ